MSAFARIHYLYYAAIVVQYLEYIQNWKKKWNKEPESALILKFYQR